MPGGNYILDPACSIAPKVPPERVNHLWHPVEEIGWC